MVSKTKLLLIWLRRICLCRIWLCRCGRCGNERLGLRNLLDHLRSAAVAAEIKRAECSASRAVPCAADGTLIAASRAEVQCVDAAAGASPLSDINRLVNSLNRIRQGNDTEVMPRRSDDKYDRYNEQCDDECEPDKEAYTRERELV